MAAVVSPFQDSQGNVIFEFDKVQFKDDVSLGTVVYCEKLANPWQVVSGAGRLFHLSSATAGITVVQRNTIGYHPTIEEVKQNPAYGAPVNRTPSPGELGGTLH